MPNRLSWSDLVLQDILGEGHTGVVFRASLRNDVGALPKHSIVAVKRYKRWVLDERGQLDRILMEADAGRSISHPNLALVFGAVLDDQGQPALVMKYYDGDSLETVLRKHRQSATPLPFQEGLAIVRGLAGGIAALHARSLIHRDIKPANVIMTANGPVLTDFGVLKSQVFAEQTTTGEFLGTIRYAAPEYLFGQLYDARIDVYGFGGVAYEIFSGRQLFWRHRHWARLVAAKVSAIAPLGRAELEGFARRSSIRAARFIQYVINRARCEMTSRTLDLTSVVMAIEQRLWEGTFSCREGRITPGLGKHVDRFGSAEAAAEFVSTVIPRDELPTLKAVLRRTVWHGYCFATDLDQATCDLFSKYRLLAAGTESQWHIRPAPSLCEAFIFGLV